MGTLDRFRPGATRSILLLLAGSLWVLVGLWLLVLAVTWLSALSFSRELLFAGAGVVLALLVHRFGFLRIADRNLARLLAIRERRCLFSFIPWRSYLVIVVMTALGSTLRHSAIPKQYLAIAYLAIGLALVLSSQRYLRAFLRDVRGGPAA